MLRKALLVSSACILLAGCATDKVSFSSEVGGSGSSGAPGANGSDGSNGSNGSDGSNGSNGSDGGILGSGGTISDGLGVTGSGGAISNILGTDPIGGVVDAALGGNNAIAQILGGGDGGIVPQLAAAVAGDQNATVLGGGLGIDGSNGLLADLAGVDLGGGVLGTQGVIPAGLAGGNDGLLGALLGDNVANPPLASVVQAVPTSTLADAVTQVPQLGITGDGGAVDKLIGIDLVGNLVGTSGGVTSVLAGGGDGAIGSQVPAGSPLTAVGSAVTSALDAVAGTSPSPIAGATSSLPALDSLSGQLGSVPLAGSVIGTVLDTVSGTTSTGGATSPVSGALVPVTSTVATVTAPVTSTLDSVPVVGGVVTGLLGK